MSNPLNDPKLAQFLKQDRIDADALGDLQKKIEADDPWSVPCPEALRGQQYLIHEHVRFLKVTRAYDICHPVSAQTIIECREPKVRIIDRMSRLLGHSSSSGFEFEFRDMFDRVIMKSKYNESLKKMDDKVTVFNQKGQQLGVVRVFSGGYETGGRLENNRYLPLASVTGGKEEYSFSRTRQVVARVTRESSGMVKDSLTESDTYRLEFSEELPAEDPLRILILAAVIRVDIGLDVSDDHRTTT